MLTKKLHHLIIFLLFVLPNVLELKADTLRVGFEDNDWFSLLLRYGPNDNPAQQDTNYTVKIFNGQAHYIIPSGTPGVRMSGFLDLPENMVPIKGNLNIEWTFPDVSQLLTLGSTTQFAIAGCYIRGEMNHWQGGLFGDYWFAFANVNGQKLSVIRQGNANLYTEPFTATQAVIYQIKKNGDNIFQFWVKYDSENWHQVGNDITISLNPNTVGANYDVAVTHVRVLDLSGIAVDVSADDFIWYGDNIITTVDEDKVTSRNFELYNNYPNPFNPTTTIKFSLNEQMPIKVVITDLLGRYIATISEGTFNKGIYTKTLNADLYNLSSGIYIYTLQTPKRIISKKMLLLK